LRFVSKQSTTNKAQIIWGYSPDPCHADAGGSLPQGDWTDNYVENLNQATSFTAWHNVTTNLRFAKERKWYDLRGLYTYPTIGVISNEWEPYDLRETTQGIVLFTIKADGAESAVLGDLYVDLKMRVRGRATLMGSALGGHGTQVWCPGYYEGGVVPDTLDIVDPDTQVVRRVKKEKKIMLTNKKNSDTMQGDRVVTFDEKVKVHDVRAPKTKNWKKITDEFEKLLMQQKVAKEILESGRTFVLDDEKMKPDDPRVKKFMDKLDETIQKQRDSFAFSIFEDEESEGELSALSTKLAEVDLATD